MQAAIDRVLRTFTLKHPLPFIEPMDDRQIDAARDDATALAVTLLGNYKTQLDRRSAKHG
jgi:hypothetical protein